MLALSARSADFILPVLRSLIDIDPRRPLYVYGAGAGGRAFARYAGLCGWGVTAYIDSRQAGEVDGVPVLQVDEYVRRRCADDLLVIASQYVTDIVGVLRARGVTGAVDGSTLASSLACDGLRWRNMVENGRISFSKAG